jgi:hypothetical protein
MSEKKWAIEVDENQLRLLAQSSELMARLLIGQVDQIHWVLSTCIKRDQQSVDWAELRDCLDEIRRIAFPDYPSGNGGPGIRSERVPEIARVLFDLQQVLEIARREAQPHDPESPRYWREPYRTSDSSKLAKVTLQKAGTDRTS